MVVFIKENFKKLDEVLIIGNVIVTSKCSPIPNLVSRLIKGVDLKWILAENI